MLPKVYIDYANSFGSTIWDPEMQKYYLDFTNHYSSNALGYSRMPDGFYNEVMRVCHVKTSMGLYDSAEKATSTGIFKAFAAPYRFNNIHFASTGSLAIEAAIKTAWAWANPVKRRIVTMDGNFHGINSFGNFVTSRRPDNRLHGVPAHGFESTVTSLEQMINFCRALRDDVAAIIIEPIQCTSGDRHFNEYFFRSIRHLCDEQGIVLIFDEIQTGFYSTGSRWYFEQCNIIPDIIVFGKKAQVSGIIVKDEFNKIFNDPMKLSVTYDGDLIDLIRCKYIIREITERKLWNNVREMSELFCSLLFKHVSVRAAGLIMAFDMYSTKDRDEFQQRCFENGLLVNTGGERTIRLRPHLAVTKEDIEKSVDIIIKSL